MQVIAPQIHSSKYRPKRVQIIAQRRIATCYRPLQPSSTQTMAKTATQEAIKSASERASKHARLPAGKHTSSLVCKQAIPHAGKQFGSKLLANKTLQLSQVTLALPSISPSTPASAYSHCECADACYMLKCKVKQAWACANSADWLLRCWSNYKATESQPDTPENLRASNLRWQERSWRSLRRIAHARSSRHVQSHENTTKFGLKDG